MTIDELTRLTRRAAAVTERLLHLARNARVIVDGMVIQAQLVTLEHDMEALIQVVQLRAIKEHAETLPPRAPIVRRRVPLSSEVSRSPKVNRFDLQGNPR